jgi:predicted Na+-dependent transporter
MAMTFAKFGANALPGKMGKSKLVSIMAQIFVPVLVGRVLPALTEKAQRNRKVRRIASVLTTVRDIWYRVDRLF